MDIRLPPDVRFAARYDRRLLGGVTVLEGQAAAATVGDWRGQLYRESRPAASKPVRLRLIPYFAWANRGESEMTVWLPRGGW